MKQEKKQEEHIEWMIDLESEDKEKIHPVLDFSSESIFLLIYLNSRSDKSEKIRRMAWFITNQGIINSRNIEKLGISLLRTIPKEIDIFSKWNVDSVVSVAKNIYIKKPSANAEAKNELLPTLPTLTTLKYPYIGSILTTLITLENTIDKYMELQDINDKTIITIWIFGTYLFPLFNSYPYLYINGLKNTGKSKLITLLKLCSFNGVHAGSITPSALFRIIDLYRPTLCIDEAEFLSNPKNESELTFLLLNGYKKGAEVIRSMQQSERGGDYIPKSFLLYCPKALANISGINDIIESRCININLVRALSNKGSLIPEDDSEFVNIRTNLVLFSLINWNKIYDIYKTLINDTPLDNRDYEIWKPLFAISKFFGDNYYNKVLEYAYRKTIEKIEEDTTERAEYLIINVLNEIVEETKYIPLIDIVNEMKVRYEDMDWLNNKRVGRMLKRIGLKEKKRIARGMQYLIKKETIEELYQRFGVNKLKQIEKDSLLIKDRKGKECRNCGLKTDFLNRNGVCEMCLKIE